MCWRGSVEDHIFLNCRVDYSRSIAQRVLMGYDNSVSVNATVVDVLELKRAIEWWNNGADVKSEDGRRSKKSMPEWWAPREDVNSDIGAILRLVSRLPEKRLTDELDLRLLRWQRRQGNLSPVAAQADILLKKLREESIEFMASEAKGTALEGQSPKQHDKMLALRELLDLVDETKELPEFTLTAGNPPYQEATGQKTQDIYPSFYIVSRQMSEFVSMVFKLGWQKSSGKASGSSLHKVVRDDKSIVSVDNYYEFKDSPVTLFAGAGTGGVNILLSDKKVDRTNIDFYEYGQYISQKNLNVIQHWSSDTDEIFKKSLLWMKLNNTKSMADLLPGRNPYGLMANVTTDPSRPEYKMMHPTHFDGALKYWARNKDNTKYNWWYCSPDTPSRILPESKESWKVVFPKSGANRVARDSFIAKPNELYTDTFISAFFESEEEAKSYQSYLKTSFYNFMLIQTAHNQHANRNVHRFIPDISGQINPRTGLIGWNSNWTDDDLKELFFDCFDASDWEYIESHS